MGASDSKPLRKLLGSISVSSDGLENKFGEVVTIDSRAPLVSAYRTLIDKKILSAPVYDGVEQKYIGFLDMRDLVSFAVHAYEQQYKAQRAAEAKAAGAVEEKEVQYASTEVNVDITKGATRNLIEDFATGEPLGKENDIEAILVAAQERQKKLEQDTAAEADLVGKRIDRASLLVNLTMRNTYQSVKSTDSLLRVAEILATGSHSVPIMDSDTSIANILTQSTLINYLATNHADALKPIFANPIQKLGTKPVIAVSHNSTVYAACKAMDDRYISGVAIVDTDNCNRLIGAFSTSDMRGWISLEGKLSFDTLSENVILFKENTKKAAADAVKRPKVISVKTSDTVGELFSKFHQFKVHRVFVMQEDDETVETVVCLKDLCRWVAAKNHQDEKNKPTLFVCDCHRCKGEFSFARKQVVDNHLYRFGRWAPWWEYQSYMFHYL